jgi:LysR family hydrogen peroxide-inducible transcriptional activator
MAKAAIECHVSQSTLSIQIRKLEEELGIALFERAAKRLNLTAAGRAVLEIARDIVRQSEKLREAAKSHSDPFTGIFRLGVFPTLAPYLLPKITPAIAAHFPQLELRLIEEKSPVLDAKLHAGEIDAALSSLPAENAHFEEAELFVDPFLLACRKDHPLASRKQVTKADLADETLLLLDEGHCLRNQALDFCFAARARENGGFRATSLETLRQMVAAGTGITLIPRIAVLPTPNLAYVPFARKDAPSRTIGLVWRQSSPQKKLLEALVTLLRKTYRPQA